MSNLCCLPGRAGGSPGYARDPSGSIFARPMPDKFVVLHPTTKYLEARQRMARFMSSALIPSKIIELLKDIDSTAEEDAGVLPLVSFNENNNQNNFVYAEDTRYPFFVGVLQSDYAARFHLLEPKVKSLINEMRNQLGTK
jgi:hypothetical protein